MHAVRKLVFLKGTDAHDYKFSSAVLEDFHHLSPEWRNRYLAASLFYLPAARGRTMRWWGGSGLRLGIKSPAGHLILELFSRSRLRAVSECSSRGHGFASETG